MIQLKRSTNPKIFHILVPRAHRDRKPEIRKKLKNTFCDLSRSIVSVVVKKVAKIGSAIEAEPGSLCECNALLLEKYG